MPDGEEGGLLGLLAGFRPTRRVNSVSSVLTQDSSATEPGGRSPHDANDGLDGISVRVAVRCRPSSGSGDRPKFEIAVDGLGGDKVLLKITASDSASNLKAKTFRCHAYFDEESHQQDVFDMTTPIIQHTLEGGNGAIMCYGATGSGKTFTLMGPAEEPGKEPRPVADGLVQRASGLIFEYIRKHLDCVYIVEASFMQIGSDGGKEQLIDLLADDDRKLELKQDPFNPSACICENQCKKTVRSAADVLEALRIGQKRADASNLQASRSHCIFTLNVESMQPDGVSVKKSKLAFVDLAGSDNLQRLQVPNIVDDDLKRKQATSVNRILSSLSVTTNPSTGSDSALLLKSFLAGNAQSLLVATIGPELENLDETCKALTFAQQMMGVRKIGSASRLAGEQDTNSLLTMKKKHNEFIRLLQAKHTESHNEDAEERKKIHQEMEDLNKKLLTKESAEKTLEDMRHEQNKNLDKMRQDMGEAVKQELHEFRMQSSQEIAAMKQTVQHNVELADLASKRAEEHEAQVRKMQAELVETQRAQRAAEDEARLLQVRLASAEERARMLQARQEELRQERADFEEERRGLRQQSEQLWQKLAAAEGELQKFKAEAEVQRNELKRLTTTRAEDADVFRKERENWRAREIELQKEISDVHRSLDDFKRNSELEAMKCEARRRETIQDLTNQISRMKTEASTRAELLSQSHQRVVDLEAAKVDMSHRMDTDRKQAALEIKRFEDELEEARHKEAELMHMLNEVQDSILVSNRGPEK